MDLGAETASAGTMAFLQALIENNSDTTDTIFKDSILLAQDPATAQLEPDPILDYPLLTSLINLAKPHINARQLKRMDYLADGRRSYYDSHAKHQTAYREAMDADVCAKLLDKKVGELKMQLDYAVANNTDKVANLRTQIEDTDIQRQKNNQDLLVCYQNLVQRSIRRVQVSAWFSSLKEVFLENEVPWLTALAEQLHAWEEAHGEIEQAESSLPVPSPEIKEMIDKAATKDAAKAAADRSPAAAAGFSAVGATVAAYEDLDDEEMVGATPNFDLALGELTGEEFGEPGEPGELGELGELGGEFGFGLGGDEWDIEGEGMIF